MIIIIGVAGGAVVIIAVVVCLCRRRNKGRSNGGPGGERGFELRNKYGLVGTGIMFCIIEFDVFKVTF